MAAEHPWDALDATLAALRQVMSLCQPKCGWQDCLSCTEHESCRRAQGVQTGWAALPVATASVARPPPAPGPAKPAQPVAEPPQDAAAVVVRAVCDIPPFVDQNHALHILKAGDVATVSPGIAHLLVRRQKAIIVEGGAT